MKVNVSVEPEIGQDSLEYEQLENAVFKTIDVPGYLCEIGLRRGGGSYYMMNALKQSKQNLKKGLIAIDPYGNIDYESNDDDVIRQDYTNGMRDETIFIFSVWKIRNILLVMQMVFHSTIKQKDL